MRKIPKKRIEKSLSRKFIFNFRINPASIKLDMKLFNHWLIFRIVKHPDTMTKGITNRCEDRLHYVLFFDYDDIYYETMRTELIALQKQEKLSDIIILCSSERKSEYGELLGSYHAYELGKYRYHDIPEILKWTSVDRNFIRVPRLFSGRGWVLRTEPKTKIKNGQIVKDKPVFKEILYSKYDVGKKKSFAHYYYLRQQFGIPFLKMNWDNSKSIQKIQYTTTSGRWKKRWAKVVI